jgi:hypothetical protein
MMQLWAWLTTNNDVFEGTAISQNYLDANAAIVKKQIGLAGLRLVELFQTIFNS